MERNKNENKIINMQTKLFIFYTIQGGMFDYLQNFKVTVFPAEAFLIQCTLKLILNDGDK